MSDLAPRVVIFDLDGVLTDTAEFHYRGWYQLAVEHGLAFDRALNEDLRGLSRSSSLEVILRDRTVEETTFAAMAERKNALYREQLATLGPDDVLPGAMALVDEARARGCKVAIGSSSRNARFVLDRLGLTDRFDAIADGATTADAKPAPDLFLAVARMLGEPPEACVVIEDATSGVEAAHAAGMRAVGVGPYERVGSAELVFATTADVDLDAVLTPGTRSSTSTGTGGRRR